MVSRATPDPTRSSFLPGPVCVHTCERDKADVMLTIICVVGIYGTAPRKKGTIVKQNLLLVAIVGKSALSRFLISRA